MKKKKLKKEVIYNIIGVIGLLFTIVLFLNIVSLNILPNKYLFLSGLVLLFIESLIFLLFKVKFKATKVLGVILTILMVIIDCFGIYYITNTNHFLDKAFSKKITTTSTYYIIAKKEKNYKEEDIEGELYYYNNFKLSDVKKSLDMFSITYVESDSLIQMFNDIKEEKINFMLIDKTNYYLAFELDKQLSSEDYKIIYEFDIKKTMNSKNSKIKNKFNLLIVGNDFAGLNDLNLLVSVNLKKNEALVTTIPRAYYIPVKGQSGRRDTLSFMAPYGIDVTIGSIEDYFGIDIDYFLKINTHSLVGIVDTIGGITYCSDQAYYTTHSLVLDTYVDNKGKFYVKKGCQELNGIETLTVARERKAFYDGDRTRQKNVVKIMQAILEKMKSANTLVNYNSILESLSDLYETDLSKEQISLIAKKLLDANEKITIEMQSVDGNETKQPVHLTDLLDFVIVPNDETVVAAKEQIDLLLK